MQNSSNTQDQLDNLKSHLVMIKSLKDSQAEDQYYILIQKAKQLLGQVSPYIANFYFQYGSFLLNKIQKGMDILNAGVVPQAQANDQIDDIPEVFDDQSQSDRNGGNHQKVEKVEIMEQKVEIMNQKIEKMEQKAQIVVYQDQNVRMTEGDQNKMEQKVQKVPNQLISGINRENQQQEKQDDIQIAYEHFQVALNIYVKQRKMIQDGQGSVLTKQQIERSILMIHSRLGDLYMLDEKYVDATDEYNAVIKHQSARQDRQYNRRISEAHYMIGNCLLHDNKENCQKLAIIQFISSVSILVKHMEVLEHYDVSKFQVPSEHKVKVDRYAYLSHPQDSETVQQIKQVVSILLDKIQDTHEQIKERGLFEQEKLKMNRAKQESSFKQVSKDVKVTNLGTFGNRKKTPTVQNSNQNSQKLENPQIQTKVKELINPVIQEKPNDIQTQNNEMKKCQ